MIDVYLVRHGQTGGNLAKRHQQEDTRLTEMGREQAANAAEFFSAIKPTHFYVSHRIRAIETARFIAEKVNMVPDTEELFVELRRPESIYGYHHHSVKTAHYLIGWWLGLVGGKGHDGEGESYEVFRERIIEARKMLESHEDNSVIVAVSHTVFINLFLAHMNRDRRLSLFRMFMTLIRVKTLKNGSITHLRYNKETGKWSVVD